jgi:hypothetical protein
MCPESSSLRLPLACLFPLASTLFLVGCFGNGPVLSAGNFTPTTLTVSPQITSLPVNGTQTFTATTNASAVTWVMVDPGPGNINVGTLTAQSNQMSVLYTAPPTPPLATIQTAGTVTLRAIANGTSVDHNFTITAPSISIGFLSNITTVALGSPLTVNAYAVGSLNNAITLQVNGVNGGSVSAGTIAAFGGIYGQYIYTAPAAVPMTGNMVTITVISQADPTKTANLLVTLH